MITVRCCGCLPVSGVCIIRGAGGVPLRDVSCWSSEAPRRVCSPRIEQLRGNLGADKVDVGSREGLLPGDLGRGK